LVPGHEDVRDELLVAGCADAEVDVRGPVRVAALLAEHVADRAVVGDRVARGHERPEREAPLAVGAEARAESQLGPLELHVVVALAVRLPGVDDRARYRLARHA